jgi:exonuclease SbcC
VKILAIRGANLASLEGAFAIDLEVGPIAQAGVFAITGPTGAGKSTLLDAMCLALFDTAPRFRGSSRVRIGRADEEEDERITSGDPRSVLRKGAASGWAEVDFRGVDGRRHRARWEVRRARGRAGGKLQPASMSVTDLESEVVIGGRKTDVRAAIEARLGLSFDQFRRSVLLAQGDFAAFLDADAKDRAELLERMTGTHIYGLISIEAHQRASVERAALAMLDETARLVTILSDEERALHHEKRAELEIRVRTDELTLYDVQRTVEWHAALAVLTREEAEAREARDTIGRQLALAETKRVEIAAYEAARPLAPRIELVDRAARVVADRERLQSDAEIARATAREAMDRTAIATVAASRAVEQAEQAIRARAKEIANARAPNRSPIGCSLSAARGRKRPACARRSKRRRRSKRSAPMKRTCGSRRTRRPRCSPNVGIVTSRCWPAPRRSPRGPPGSTYRSRRSEGSWRARERRGRRPKIARAS